MLLSHNFSHSISIRDYGNYGTHINERKGLSDSLYLQYLILNQCGP